VLVALADSADKIQVIMANGKSKADIDYDGYKETGRSIIASPTPISFRRPLSVMDRGSVEYPFPSGSVKCHA
jgi:hypothetical protein